MEKPLLNKKYLLEKYPGKGGWTFAVIPDIPKEKRAHGGYLRVKGTIDNYPIKRFSLMPMSNGHLFLPVKAEIRKKIGKKDGDYIHVTFYVDNDPLEIPEELQLCLMDNPTAHEIFLGYTEGKQKMFIDWINSAKRIETKADRIGKMLDELVKEKKGLPDFKKEP